MEFFADHDIDAPIYALYINLVENQDINAPLLEDGDDHQPSGLLNTQTSKVGEEINFDTSESEYSEEWV